MWNKSCYDPRLGCARPFAVYSYQRSRETHGRKHGMSRDIPRRARRMSLRAGPFHIRTSHFASNCGCFVVVRSLSRGKTRREEIDLAMGKKSKRRGVAQTKNESHQSRVQERRERQLQRTSEEQQPQQDDNEAAAAAAARDKALEFFVGDRVWYRDPSLRTTIDGAPRFQRGIVVESDERLRWQLDEQDRSSAPVVVSVVPMDADPDEVEKYVPITATPNEVPFEILHDDVLPLTLRFEEGDRVACNTGESGWEAATIRKLHAVWKRNSAYLCDKAFPVDDDDIYIAVPEDNDDCIRRRQDHTTLRFQKSDQVLFDSSRAFGFARPRNPPWVEGRVIDVDLVRPQVYAVYEVAYQERGRRHTCFILQDDDQHVTSATRKPRDRFLDAIAQDCAYDHFENLVLSFGLDMLPIQDLVLEQSLEHACYGSLLWLQEHAHLDLHRICFEESGRGLASRVSRSTKAERYFRKISSLSLTPYHEIPKKYIEFEFQVYRYTNREKGIALLVSLLKDLVDQQQFRLLALICCPVQGFAWELRFIPEELLLKLRDSCRIKGQHECANLIESVVKFKHSLRLANSLLEDYVHSGPSVKDSVAAQLCSNIPGVRQGTVIARAKVVIRFCRRWAGYFKFGCHKDMGIQWLCQYGRLDSVRLFLAADPLLASDDKVSCRTFLTTDRGEYLQPELKTGLSEETLGHLHLVDAVAHGDGIVSRRPDNSTQFPERAKMYLYYLEVYLNTESGPESQPIQDFLAKFIKDGEFTPHDYNVLVKYRLWLQSDDEGLTARLGVLDFLVKEKGMDPPSALDAVRWRRCGVLRWLVDEKLVDLQSPATLNISAKDAKTLQVLDKHLIPSTMQLGELLCFCCIEFDDLQSLEWLVTEKGIEIEKFSLYGWNVGHACAFFGRSEVAVWLWKLGRLGWDLVMVPCDRKPNQNAYAVQIAVEKGFIFVADVLLKAGSPVKDKCGRDIVHYAERSGHKFVLEYVQSLKNPLELETDIRRLLQIHAEDAPLYEKTKKFLVENRCLAMERWRDSGHQSSFVSGPLGMTFREVLSKLCCPEHPELVAWLYMELSGEAKQLESPHHWSYFWKEEHDFNDLSEVFLDADGLRSFALEAEDEKLMSWLGREWASGMRARDPARKGSLLAWFQKTCGHNKCLAILRAKELRGNVIYSMRWILDKLLQSLLVQGEELQRIEWLVQDLRDLLFEVLEVETREIDNQIEISSYLVQADGNLNAKVQLIDPDWKSNLMEKMMRFRSSCRAEYCRLSVFLVVEGYKELVQWLVEKENALDLEDYCEAVNVAAYMGHVNIVQLLLRNEVSSPNRMLEAALFGAVEGGRGLVLDFLTRSTEQLLVPPKDPFLSYKSDAEHSSNRIRDLMQSSLVLAAVFGCLNGPQESPDSLIDAERASVLQWMVNEQPYDPVTLLQAIPFGLKYTPDGPNCIRCGFALAQWIVEELGAEWWQVTSLSEITREALAIVRYLSKEDQDAIQEVLEKWLSYLVSIGFDILAPLGDAVEESYVSTLSDQRLEQVRVFSQFEVLKHQQPLSEVKRAIQDNLLSCTCRDKGGLLITHVAAAYDRVDVLKLVVEEMGMPLKATDFQGRDALAIAEASNATESVKWITNHLAVATISSFCSSNFLRRKESIRYREVVDSILTIQSWYRAELVRRRHHRHLKSRMKSSMAFRQLWKVTIDVCDKMVASPQPYHYESWEALKESQCDFLGLSANDDERVSKRIQRQDAATESALLSEDINAEENGSDCDNLDEAGCSAESSPADDCMVSERVYLTNDVLKWLRVADTKYRTFFSRQVKRLAAGERGRKLAKRLIGTHQSLIYEAYLEQKAGHRILWTPSSDHQSLLIWYVVAHDDVSRFMKLIDNSENRSSRQQTDAALIVDAEGDLDPAANNVVPRRVQLDPRGNTPLKLFEVRSDEIECLADKNWVPQLYLTDEELNIVESKGTVLVLGRSGTGKTICIGNRMEYDRRRFDSDMSFSQLFVARSQRLCSFVKASVEECTTSDFKTFDQLLRSLERTLPDAEGSCRGLFLPSQKVDFQKFKREVHSSSDGVDALIVWSSIRSFIKGSIQALQQTNRVLSESEYMDLGKRRCRLSREQREVVYKTFLRYDCYMKEHNFWDDMDRVSSIVERLEKARSIASPEFDLVRRTKAYVDEVQDYTQAEIYIFFLLSGPGDLFLAGDPCQSVVEGVEFRFEEIRSVGFYVCGTERRHLIPEKPKTVNVNFRSHSGILQTAAAVLSCLFGAFPESAKQLKEDHGLFSGPRPGVFSRGGVSFQRLREAISAGGGIVVLTHDVTVPQCKDALGGYPLVYGIREAKGLEFQSVVLVDFFSELPRALQKPWRDLLLGRTDDVNFSTRYPEVEGQLKLLYTAITRCMHRLFFAETKSSIAGDAFVRWLTTCSTTTTSPRNTLLALGTRCSLNDVEKMQQTPDDWRSAGFDNAIMAEADLDAAAGWMEKAIYCFQQAEDIELASKARVYKSSVQCRASLLRKNRSDEEEVESDVAQLVKSLLVEHLVGEAVLLCRAALPFLPPYSQEQVTEQLLRRLVASEEEDEG